MYLWFKVPLVTFVHYPDRRVLLLKGAKNQALDAGWHPKHHARGNAAVGVAIVVLHGHFVGRDTDSVRLIHKVDEHYLEREQYCAAPALLGDVFGVLQLQREHRVDDVHVVPINILALLVK